jgi:competence protein ComEC
MAIAAGAATGAILLPGIPSTVIVPALVVASAAAAAAHVLARSRAFVAAISAVFGLSACLLAIDRSADALHPSLLGLVERRAPGLIAGLSGESPLTLEIEGTLREDASRSAGGYTLSLAVDSAADSGERRRVSGGLVLTVFGDLAVRKVGGWLAGRPVRVTAQVRPASSYLDPGVRDNRLNLARRGTILVGSVKSAALVELSGRGSWVAESAARCRRFARAALNVAVGRWSERSAAIVTAILIGDRAGLDEEIRERLQQAGTYHVIAISGGNIAILAGLSMFLLRLCGIGSRTACAATAAALVFYAGLVGGGASVVRATLMGVTYLLARMGDHRGAALNALGVSVSLILVATPLALFDPALALTAGATLGILIGSQRLAGCLPSLPWIRVPATLGLASVSAELALFPVAAFFFSRVTFAGLVLNFAAIPLMTIAQVAGMAVLPLSCVFSPAASMAGLIAHLGAAGLVESARLVDFAPWLARRLPPPSGVVVAAYYAGWLVRLVALPQRRVLLHLGRIGAVVAALSGLWVVVWPIQITRPRGDGNLEVTFLDVGQADAMLVRFPDGQSLLVDTGGQRGTSTFDVGARVVAPALWAIGVRRLDMLAITHADPDHIGGAPAVVRDLRPHEIWEGVPVPPDPLLGALRKDADRFGVAWRTVRRGDRWDIGGVTVRVLHPPEPDWERQRVRNDDSLVLELMFGAVSVLLPGDISGDIEREVAPRLTPAAFRLLKVPHHGSASSSTPGFLAAARPAVAILTVGRGTIVARDVVERYHDAGATLIRTDAEGAVTFSTDGTHATIRTFKGGCWSFRPAPVRAVRRP